MPLKILFMGTPEFSVPILESIYKSRHKLVNVYTQPPKNKARGQKLIESPIHLFSRKLNLNVRCPKNLNNDEEFNFIKNLAPNVVIVSAYGQIIPENILNIPNIIFINVHASLLPKWRGAAPIQRSIMAMDQETGISIMKIIKELDAGPYMLQEKIKIRTEDNHQILSEKLSEIGAKLAIKSLDLIEMGEVNYIPQNNNEATYAKKIKKEECQIKWDLPAKKLVAKINGLSPFPGAWFEHNNNRLKIIKAEEASNSGKIGEIIDDRLTIGCFKNSVKIIEIQKEGKKILKTQIFLSGYRIKKNEILN
ncbi:MAG: methionyl-tRNA formyltransferase [Pelagibacterales bacterium]|jgi:methionyl-tRNA formyltransferase|nr:methionyl-tRNA formyltransferase [Pelagibacterales bacterium]